ncbi:hypothetical protein TFKS16_1172 [Tannerella forsythia KS16]|uniref:Uncharacterized protein n=1 Tax=Tannerella forsythia (strain ATCC 43037 / JCM 10827 / CCUG 21028 A / KCTC 5666 / FDC 338) TaxID=203275 RepID=G8UQ14_TANFA|nr:hypothetical protein BFO_0984 [Tannerella forsythia 92A2]BAR51441.1 hypothetical protein TFKS16_1172 [Tannerella forsythia KS16]
MSVFGTTSADFRTMKSDFSARSNFDKLRNDQFQDNLVCFSFSRF